ncbi:MAG: hypothetical protein LUC35_06690 [Clostridiales bacterium]|nr:hypothetical protein [Clostridiales bacterium]
MKKKAILKNGIKAVAFLLIFALLFQLTTELLRTKWVYDNQERYVYSGLYETAADSIDVLVLGSSQVTFGVSPVVLYDRAGISSYSLGGANASVVSNYYWLIEAEMTQDPSVVVLETSCMLEKLSASHERMRLDGMKLSANKLRFIQSFQDCTNESFLSFAVPLIKYHTRWSKLTSVDFDPDIYSSLCYRGFNVTDRCKKGLKYETMVIDNDDPEENVRKLYDYQVEYFEKIVAYCQENGVELLLIKTPKYSWTGSDSNQIQALADTCGLTYLDFNYEELMEAMDFDITTDMKDQDHLNTTGADKLSSYLADYLTEHCDLPDRRNDADYDLQIDRELYETERTDARLTAATDPAEWLALLKKHTACDILLSTYGDTAGLVSDELAALLADLGLETDLNALEEGYGFVARLTNDGTSVEEKTEKGYVSLSGELDDGTTYQVSIRNESSSKQSRQLIAGEDRSVDSQGLNITVYDQEEGLTIETVCIDLETGEMTCVTRADS